MNPDMTRAEWLRQSFVTDPSVSGQIISSDVRTADFYASNRFFNRDNKQLSPDQAARLNSLLAPLNDEIQRLLVSEAERRLPALMTAIDEGRFAPTSTSRTTPTEDGLPTQTQLREEIEAVHGEFSEEWTWVLNGHPRFGQTAVWFSRRHNPEFFSARDTRRRLFLRREEIAREFMSSL